ncbi:MAG: hypothetical protein JSR82_04260 [Verrucomicrobia bacterium]|nr:hypothetical protein [Verrucomicrobiota bacterium]
MWALVLPAITALAGLALGRRWRRSPRRLAPEASLEDEQLRARLALESAGAGWWRWDRRTDEVTWDPRVGGWLGLPAEPTGGLNAWLNHFGVAERAAIDQQLRQAGGARRQGAFDLRPPGGGPALRFTFELRGGPEQDVDRIEAVVTEAPPAASAPAPLAPALKAVWSSSAEGLCLLELHPPMPVWQAPERLHEALLERSRIVYCNDTFAVLHGVRSAAEVQGKAPGAALTQEAGSLAPLAQALVRTQFRLDHWPTPAGTGGVPACDNTLHGVLRAGEVHQIWWRRCAQGTAAHPRAERAPQHFDCLCAALEQLLPIPERASLLQALCRVAVEKGEFAAAWVAGWQGGRLQPLATFGLSHGTLQSGAEPTPWWAELAQRSLAAGEMQLFGLDGPVPAALEHRQVRALAVVPLHASGQPVAAWFLERHAAQPELAADLGLVGELTRLVSWALSHLHQEARSQATAEQLKALRSDYQNYVVSRTRDLRTALIRLARTPRHDGVSTPEDPPAPAGPLEDLVEVAPQLDLELARPLNAEEEDHLREVQAESSRLLLLCRNLLDRVQIEAGHLPLQRESFDFAGLVHEVIELLAKPARQRSLNLEAVTEKPRLPIIGDRRRVQQVLLNLVDNAVKFTVRGEVHVQARFDGADLVFEVSDTGAGLTTDELTAMFEAFRAGTTSPQRRRLVDPAGLGLHLCWKLVGRMGGRMEAESRLGQGSVFRVWIPRRAPVPGEAERPDA